MSPHKVSAAIASRKGFSVEPDVLGSGSKLSAYVDALDTLPTGEQIKLAHRVVAELQPKISSLFASMRLDRVVRTEAARGIVERLMSETSTPTLINIARLEDAGGEIDRHSLAVSALMIAFGRNLGLTEEAVRLLGLGGLLHDIGKMVLPVRLLQKPGRFSIAELVVIRTHPELGHQILAQNADVPKVVSDICLHHHERYDGTGYPHGLAGNDISFETRIASICDVYAALTAARPYKRAWSRAEAIGAMHGSRGHFDPELLASFVKLLTVDCADVDRAHEWSAQQCDQSPSSET